MACTLVIGASLSVACHGRLSSKPVRFQVGCLTDLFASEAPNTILLPRITSFTYLGFPSFSCIGGGSIMELPPARLLVCMLMTNSFCSRAQRVMICVHGNAILIDRISNKIDTIKSRQGTAPRKRDTEAFLAGHAVHDLQMDRRICT